MHISHLFSLDDPLYTVIDSMYILVLSSNKQQPSALILIAFEYAIMAAVATTTLAKYTLGVIDSRIEGIWHAKVSYEFTLDFISEVNI